MVAMDATALWGLVVPPATKPHLILLPGIEPQHRVVRDCDPYTGTILAQNRQVYDPFKIAQLAESIHLEGLINAPEVAALTETEAQEYLRVWNRVWGKRYKLSHLDRDGDYYLAMVDGHCRKLAGIKLCEEGRPPTKWVMTFLYGITAEEALDRQFQENIHTVPETWEDAEAAYRYWKFLEEFERAKRRKAKLAGNDFESGLTIAKFSLKVGRSESAVRDYLKFGKAPRAIQTAVRQNRISFGKGVLLAKACISGVITGKEHQDNWLIIAELPGLTNTEFERSLNGRIEKARHQQTDMFGEMDVESVAQALASDRRAIVLPQLIRRLHENTLFFGKALDLSESGQLGPGQIYSGASVGRALLREIVILERLLPYLRGEVANKRLEAAQRIIAESGELLTELFEEPTEPPQEEALF